MMKNKDRKAKLSSAYHEFSIHRRLFWLVSFLRFAIPCCDFPHDELSWRKSWDDDLNLEVIQQLYILTASFAPEHRINIQWNQSCQHDRRHLLFSRVSNEIQGISNRIVRMRDISLLCSYQQSRSQRLHSFWSAPRMQDLWDNQCQNAGESKSDWLLYFTGSLRERSVKTGNKNT